MNSKKLLRKIVVAAIIILTVYAGYTVVVQQIALMSKNAEIQELRKQLDDLAAQKEELRKKIENSDTEGYIETTARELLNWVKEGEIIFVPAPSESP